MTANGNLFTRLRSLAFALAVFALFIIGSGLVSADQTAVLEGVRLDSSSAGQSLAILLNGRVDYELTPLEGEGAIQLFLPDCELGSKFAVPALKTGDLVRRIDYKLSLQKGIKSVTLIITLRDDIMDKGSYSVEESDGNITVAVFGSKPADLLVANYSSSTPTAAGMTLDGVEVTKLDGQENVRIQTSSSCKPEVHAAAFPFRVIVEFKNTDVSTGLGKDYSYNSSSGLIHSVGLTQYDEDNSVRLVITAPDAGSFKADDTYGTEHLITIYGWSTPDTAMEAGKAPEPVEIGVPESIETPEKPVETPAAPPEPRVVAPPVPAAENPPAPAPEQVREDPPLHMPRPMSYGSVDVVEEVSDYPDLPVVTEEQEGEYFFPTEEPSVDKKHISDAVVSLNFEGASFIDVMMILASQAGVDFVLDAYWNQAPTGHIRERPPGGPSGGRGVGGGITGGGGFAPVGGSGSVTLQVTNRTFDEVFQMLMLQNSLDFEVFRPSPDAEPIVFISTRERLQEEMGLGIVKIYQVHYVDPGSAFYFLQQMDMIPSTSGYGYWYYGGGNNGTGGGGNQGGGGSRGGVGGGGGGSRGGGGFGRSAENPDGGFASPVAFSQPTGVLDAYPPSIRISGNLPAPEPFQAGGFSPGGGGGGSSPGGGGGGQGGQGGQGGGGGGLYTAKVGAIGIMATEDMHETIKAALDQIDKPPKQIFVETTFISVDVNPEQRPDVWGVDNLGDWAYEYGSDRFRFQFDAVNNEGIVFEVLPKNQQVPFDDFRARYKWLYFDRRVKIVSSPRVAVIEGYTGSVSVQENRPFIIDGGVIIDQFGNAIPAPDQVTFVPTGTFLTITPYIDDFGNVTMFLNPTNSSLLGEPQLIEGNLVFGTVNTNVSTILRLRDGETIVLGGMTQNSLDIERQSIPFLGDLPIIGVLFGRTERQKIDNQLVILLTTHIVGS